VLVDHVQELEPPTVSGTIEMEINGPGLVGVLGLLTPNRAIGWRDPLLVTKRWPLQPYLPPEPVHTLVVHQPASPPKQAGSHAPSPADVVHGNLAETTVHV
jgi:hypothetical protein